MIAAVVIIVIAVVVIIVIAVVIIVVVPTLGDAGRGRRRTAQVTVFHAALVLWARDRPGAAFVVLALLGPVAENAVVAVRIMVTFLAHLRATRSKIVMRVMGEVRQRGGQRQMMCLAVAGIARWRVTDGKRRRFPAGLQCGRVDRKSHKRDDENNMSRPERTAILDRPSGHFYFPLPPGLLPGTSPASKPDRS